MSDRSVPGVERPDWWAWVLAGPLPDVEPTEDHLTSAATLVRRATQILPQTLTRLAAWAGPRFRDHPLLVELHDEVRVRRAFTRVMACYAQHILQVLAASGIQAVLLKGSAVRLCAYGDLCARGGDDIDVGVCRDDVTGAERVLCGLDFEPAEWFMPECEYRRANVFRRLLAEVDHHELGHLVRWTQVPDADADILPTVQRLRCIQPWTPAPDGTLACNITVDLHHGLSNSLEMTPVMSARRLVARDDVDGWIPAPAWLLFHAIIKLYWESHQRYREGFHLLLDVIELLNHATPDDLVALFALADTYGVHPATFYVLRRAAPLTITPDRPQIASYLAEWETVREGQSPVSLRDLGDFWPKLWGYR